MSKITNGTKILTCTCISAFQDELYGTKKRVANKCGGKTTNSNYKCSVCSKELG